MSYYSHAHAIENTRTEARSALPDAPMVPEPATTFGDAARLRLARVARRVAAAQLRWARRQERRALGRPACSGSPA